MRKLILISVLACVLPGYAQSMFGPGQTITIAKIETSGRNCRVTALVQGYDTWVVDAKNAKECAPLRLGAQYTADINRLTREETLKVGHFHDGWYCSGRDCYDSGTYFVPAQSGILTTVTFGVHAGNKIVKLINRKLEANPPS